jgi:S1-C subfamily serine protease
VAHQELPQDLREKLKIEKGALVTRVIDASPAATAGIQAGDVLVSVNGKEVTSANLKDVVSSFPVGQEVNLVYVHDGNKVTKGAKLGDQAKIDVAAKPKEEPKRDPVTLGVEVEEQDDGKLLVLVVDPGFTGAVAGLAKGDKITHLNGKEVKTVDDISAELKKALAGDQVAIAFLRPGDKEDLSFVASVRGASGKEGAQLLNREEKKIAKAAKPEEKKKAVLGVSVIPDAEGVRISAVEPQTAAHGAGIEKGDIVRKVNGEAVPDVEKLSAILGKLSAGDKISFELDRGGKTVELKDVLLRAEGEKVAVAAKPEDKPAPKPEEKPAEKPKKPGRLKVHAETSAAGDQVSITQVEKDGPGDKAGLKIGDLILQVNDKKIRNTDELSAALKPLFAGDAIKIKIRRGTEEKEVAVTLGEAAPETAPKA